MGGGYGYAGEWTDASGLQYLRARYYSHVFGGIRDSQIDDMPFGRWKGSLESIDSFP